MIWECMILEMRMLLEPLRDQDVMKICLSDLNSQKILSQLLKDAHCVTRKEFQTKCPGTLTFARQDYQAKE